MYVNIACEELYYDCPRSKHKLMLICHEFDKQANNGTKIKTDDKGGQPSLSYSVLKWWKDAQ